MRCCPSQCGKDVRQPPQEHVQGMRGIATGGGLLEGLQCKAYIGKDRRYASSHSHPRSQCKECLRSGICPQAPKEHMQGMQGIVEMRARPTQEQVQGVPGSGIYHHKPRTGECKECGGSQICEHARRRSQCKDRRCASIIAKGARTSSAYGRTSALASASGACARNAWDRRHASITAKGASERSAWGRVPAPTRARRARERSAGDRRYASIAAAGIRSTCKECLGSGICPHSARRVRARIAVAVPRIDVAFIHKGDQRLPEAGSRLLCACWSRRSSAEKLPRVHSTDSE